MLNNYIEEANLRGGHTPHVLEQALSWHIRYKKTGSMLQLDIPRYEPELELS
jgi:succinyl-CoA:acetate CoA-transferase